MSPRLRSKTRGPLPRARRRKLAEDYLAGASLQAVSVKYRISPSTAASLLQAEGVELRRRGAPKRQLTIREIVEREYREKQREQRRPREPVVEPTVPIFDWDDD